MCKHILRLENIQKFLFVCSMVVYEENQKIHMHFLLFFEKSGDFLPIIFFKFIIYVMTWHSKKNKRIITYTKKYNRCPGRMYACKV